MDNFKQYLTNSGLSNTTITNHIRNMNKLNKIFDDNLQQFSLQKIIETLKQSNLSLSQQLTITSTLSKYFEYKNMERKPLQSYIFEINNSLKQSYLKRNKQLDFPYTKNDLYKELNKFYENQDYKKYIVSYLIIKYNVRNEDVNLFITTHKKYTNKEQNFLIIRKNSILYIRNDYKTSKYYGTIVKEIKHTNFIKSVNEYYNQNSNDIENNVLPLFKTFYNSTKQIKKLTPFNLKESDIMKIILQSNNSLSQSIEISQNRGSGIHTLNNNYNLKNHK